MFNSTTQHLTNAAIIMGLVPRNLTLAEERYLTTKDVERLFRIPCSTLNTMRSRGGGPPFIKTKAGGVFYERLDIETWLSNQKFASTAEYSASKKSGN